MGDRPRRARVPAPGAREDEALSSAADGPVAGGEPRWSRAVDTALAMLVIVVVGSAITADLGAAAGPRPAAYAFAVGWGAVMFVRRRAPVLTLLLTAVALLVYYTLGFPPVGLALPVAAALYSAAEQGRGRWAVGTAVVLLAVSTSARVLESDDLSLLLGYELPVSIGLMAAAIALGDGVRARRGWRAELRRQVRAAEAEREREAERRVEQERVRIARDLHDLLAHTVSVISLHVDVARETLDDDPGGARRSLGAARGACGRVVGELRATLQALRTDDTTPTPGLDRLDELVETARAAGLTVRTERSGTPAPLPAVADSTAYRIVQESVSNVLRHARAGHVLIEIDHGPTDLRVRVRDDGRGVDTTDPGPGWGLVGMRERLTLLGGTLRTESPADGGFVVEARIPAGEP